MTLAYGQTQAVELIFTPENPGSRQMTWTSSDPGVAAVDENGNVTGLLPGSATVTGVTTDGSNKKVRIGVTVRGGTLPASLRILTTDVSVSKDRGKTVFTLNFRNNTGATVWKPYYLYYCYDREGNARFNRDAETGALTDYRFIIRYGHGRQADGTTDFVTVTLPFDETDSWLGGIRVALYKYELRDGTIITVPDTDLYWYDTALNGYLPREAVTSASALPDGEAAENAGDDGFGILTDSVYSYCMAEYNSPEPGLYILETAEDSPADRAGIRAGDMLCGADELDWAHEPDFMAYAMQRLKSGTPVTLHIVRGGEKLDLTVNP